MMTAFFSEFALKLRWLSPVLALILMVSALQAQDQPPAGDEEAFELFDISLEDLLNVGMVSASKRKQSVSDAPATAHVITAEQIRNRGYMNLADLLQDIPEVEIQFNSTPEFRNQFTFRGVSGSEKFLIMMNGVRVTPYTGDGYTLGSNFSLGNAKRVEVILGPASALYGVDAFSGIINIITFSAEESQYNGASLRGAYGNYGTTDNSFTAGAKADKLHVSVAGSQHYSNEPNYDKLYPGDFNWFNNMYKTRGLVVESPYYQKIRNVNDFRTLAGQSYVGAPASIDLLMPTFAYSIFADINYKDFTVGFYRNSERHASSHGLDPRFAARGSDAFSEMYMQTIYARHNYRSFNRKWNLQSTLSQSSYETNPESNFMGAVSRWQPGYFYAYGQSAKIEEQFSYDFSRRYGLIAGASYEDLSALPRTGLSPKPFNPDLPGDGQDLYFIGAAGYAPYFANQSTQSIFPFNDSLTLTQNFYYLKYQNYGSYAQMWLNPKDNVELTLGARYDYNTRFGATFNPRLGLVLTPAKNLKLKMLYGESYLAPSPRKAYEQSGSFYEYTGGQLVGDFFRTANPALQPEKLRSAELGASYIFGKSLSVSGNGFYTLLENLIDPFGEANPAFSPANINVSRLETSVNRGNSTVVGATGKLNYLLKFAQWSCNAFGAYTYTDGDINGAPLLFTARHTGKMGMEVSGKRFSVYPSMLLRSASYSNLTDGPGGDYLANKSFYVLNIYARYDLLMKSKFKAGCFVKGTNITDNRYYNVSAGSEDGMARTPQDPLRITAGFLISLY